MSLGCTSPLDSPVESTPPSPSFLANLPSFFRRRALVGLVEGEGSGACSARPALGMAGRRLREAASTSSTSCSASCELSSPAASTPAWLRASRPCAEDSSALVGSERELLACTALLSARSTPVPPPGPSASKPPEFQQKDTATRPVNSHTLTPTSSSRNTDSMPPACNLLVKEATSQPLARAQASRSRTCTRKRLKVQEATTNRQIEPAPAHARSRWRPSRPEGTLAPPRLPRWRNRHRKPSPHDASPRPGPACGGGL